MPGQYIVNGKFYSELQPSISPENRSYRYGDGLFETIRMANGKLPLWELHWQRLTAGLQTLHIPAPKLFTSSSILDQIMQLCSKNDFVNARIRINVSRGDGGILEQSSNLHYSIQTWNLEEPVPKFNENGLSLGIFDGGRKSMDHLSNLKSNSYLIYVMAALYAKEFKFNDAIVLNTEGRAVDSSIANIFWVKDSEIYTPPKTEGPVAGVMRSFLSQQIPIKENPLDIETIRTADEMFITNAIRGIQWVASVEETSFHSCLVSENLYHKFIRPLFS